MKTLENIKGIVEDHKEELRQKYKVKEIGIFGSYVRGEQKAVSDVDILVEFEGRAKIGLLKMTERYIDSVTDALKVVQRPGSVINLAKKKEEKNEG